MTMTELKVVTLNCWGIPVVSTDRRTRMRLIGEWLAQCGCDVACLQEVWSEADYETVRAICSSKLPHAHYFHSGVVGSGVCVMSRHPLLEAFFHQWPVNGYMHKVQHGDWWGGKGVGLCRILVAGRWHVHIYSAHLHAEYDRARDVYLSHRVLQAYDTAQFIRLTGASADAVVLAGDLNTEPGDLACQLLLGAARLHDSCPAETAAEWQTHETPSNTYTTAGARPKRIDYVLYGGKAVTSATKYAQPLPARAPGTQHSYSDHEAVCATLQLGQSATQSPPVDDLAATLVQSLRILAEARVSLSTHRRIYLCACVVLCAALWTIAADGSSPWPWPLGLVVNVVPGGQLVLHIARLALTALMLFTLVMATLWNRIEGNAVKATQLAMCLELNLLNAHTSLGTQDN